MRMTLSADCLREIQIRRRFMRGLERMPDEEFEMELFHGLFGRPRVLLLGLVRERALQGTLSLDLVSAELLRHFGVNPAVCAYMAGMCEVTLLDHDDLEPTNYVALIKGCRARITVSEAARLMWDEGERSFQMPILPESTFPMMQDLRLSRIVGHPALDPLPLIVRRKTQDHAKGTLTLQISGSRWLDGRSVAAYLPGDDA